MVDFEEKEKALKSLKSTITRLSKNEADATRTRNLRIDSPMIINANPSFPTQKRRFLQQSDSQLVSGLFSALKNDFDLRLIVERWPELPEHIKAAIKALVQTHTGSKRG